MGILIRPFNADDAPVIQRNLYPEVQTAEIIDMIAEWNTSAYRGRHFEMFAIIAGEDVVGSISLYERSKSVVSLGVEVFPDERRKGYAAEAMRQTMQHAQTLGYRIVQDQVRTDNQPSMAMHRSLGFETDGTVYRKREDRDVLLYLYCL